MPDLPWTTRARMEPGSGYLVMASHLPLKRISSTVRFFCGVSAVRRHLGAADGLVGYTLRARPLARDCWTLSVWTGETALREFMRTPPHVRLMASLKPVMDRQCASRGRSTPPAAGPAWPVLWSGWLPASSRSRPLRLRPGRPCWHGGGVAG